jgi:hypothetical protein
MSLKEAIPFIRREPPADTSDEIVAQSDTDMVCETSSVPSIDKQVIADFPPDTDKALPAYSPPLAETSLPANPGPDTDSTSRIVSPQFAIKSP